MKIDVLLINPPYHRRAGSGITDWGSEQTWAYVNKFCEIRGKPTLSREIEQAYRHSTDLADVLQNPLLLTLFLWVVEESGMSLPLDIRDRASVLGEVVRLLVDREVGRAGIERAPNRVDVIRGWQLAAWEIYRARAHEEDINVDQLGERVSRSDKIAAKLTGSTSFLDLLDRNPHSGYVRGMVHEVLWEYLVGAAIADGVKYNQHPFPQCFEYVNRVEINRFVREIWARDRQEIQLDVVARLKDTFSHDVPSTEQYANLRRSHAAYYIGRMPLQMMVDELKKLDEIESDIMVKLSIAFGLVKLGDAASEERLWHKLDTDETWDSYNRGYHLVYYRDWSAERRPPPYRDDGTVNWDRTYAALLRHLISEEPRHVSLRRIEMLTMRRFIQTRRSSAPLDLEEIRHIGVRMHDTPDLKPGFKEAVLNEFENLQEAWKIFRAR